MRFSGFRISERPPQVPTMPPGLVELMQGLSRDVLKNNPSNVYEFCANHMQKLLEIRDGPTTKKSLSLEQKIFKAQEKVRQRAEQRRQKFDRQVHVQSTQDSDAHTIPTKCEEHVDEKHLQSVLKAPILQNRFLTEASEVEISHDSHEEKTAVEKDLIVPGDKPDDLIQKSVAEEIAATENVPPIISHVSDIVDMLSQKQFVESKADLVKQVEKINEPSVIISETEKETGNQVENEELRKTNSASMKEIQKYIVQSDDNLPSNESCKQNQEQESSDAFDMDAEITPENIEYALGHGEELAGTNDLKETGNYETQTSTSEIVNPEILVIPTIETSDNPKLDEVHADGTNNVGKVKVDDDINGMVSIKPEILIALTDNNEDSRDLTDNISLNKTLDFITQVVIQHDPEESECKTNLLGYEAVNISEVDGKSEEIEKIVLGVGEKSDINIPNESISELASDDIICPVVVTEEIKEDKDAEKFDENKSEVHIKQTHVEKSQTNNAKDTEIPNTKNVQEADFDSQTSLITEFVEGDKVGNNKAVEDECKVQEAQAEGAIQSSMDLETAAITIQKVFRTFLFKSRASTFDDTTNEATNLSDEDSDDKEESEYAITSSNLNNERRPLGLTRMDTVLQTVNEEKSLSLSTDDSSTLSSAATTIQAHVRGFLIRNRLNSNKTVSSNSLVNSNTSLDYDTDHHKNKTVLNIHIVPEGGNLSRDESIITSMDLSLDSSPPSSINLHPLGYDKSERRKLKREDAIQSVSPPSNNSGKLSEESVKDVIINDITELQAQGMELITADNHREDTNVESQDTSPTDSTTPVTVINVHECYEESSSSASRDSEMDIMPKRKSFTKICSDEMDVVTPFLPNSDRISTPLPTDSNIQKLEHSGEFHDMVLPTKVSRCDTAVVRGE